MKNHENLAPLRDALGKDTDQVRLEDAWGWYGSLRQSIAAVREVGDERCRAGAPRVRIVGEPAWAGWSASDRTGVGTGVRPVVNVSIATAPVTSCVHTTRSPHRAVCSPMRGERTLSSSPEGRWGRAPICDPVDMLLETV